MHKILYIPFSIINLNCTSPKTDNINVLLQKIDYLLDNNVDSAYKMLISVKNVVDSINEVNISMKYLKSLADAQNKLYLNMISDSIFDKVVKYYDEKGTSNEQIKCHYLQGCIYRDLRESPMALKCFQEAIDIFDNTDKNVDYHVVMAVFGQMGELFYKQYFLDKSIDSYKKYSYCALRSGDIYNYIRGIEFQIQPYLLLTDTNMVYVLTDSVHNLFLKYNMPDKAIRANASVLNLYIEKQDYQKAKIIIDEFENKSGIFDEEGNVDSLYSRFYYSKGMYYLGINIIDSAEFFFRKLLRKGFVYDSYNGLLSLFRKKEQVDSVLKYSKLRDEAYDEVFNNMKINALSQAASMYDYMRIEHQKEILQKTNNKFKFTLFIVLIISINTIIIIVFCYKKYIKRKNREMLIFRNKYNSLKKFLDNEKQYYYEILFAYNCLKKVSSSNNERLKYLEQILHKKQIEIEELEKELLEYKNKYQLKESLDNIALLKESDIVQSIKEKLEPFPHGDSLNSKEMRNLINNTKKFLPRLNKLFIKKSRLTKLETLTTILILLDFNTSEISFLINTSTSRVSNIKLNINKKLGNYIGFDPEELKNSQKNDIFIK